MSHSPEPWRVADGKLPFTHGTQILDANTDAVVASIVDESESIDKANADRIVACVNACRGIADPVQFMRHAHELWIAVKRESKGRWLFPQCIENQLDGMRAAETTEFHAAPLRKGIENSADTEKRFGLPEGSLTASPEPKPPPSSPSRP